MNDSLPAELKFRENIGPGLRGEKMLTYAIWHGFLAAQPLDLFVEIDHNQLTQYWNLPIFSVNGMSCSWSFSLTTDRACCHKGLLTRISPGSHYEHETKGK